MDGDEVGPGQKLVQGDQFRPDFGRQFFGDKGVVAQDPHPQAQGSFGYHGADASHADDPQGLIEQFGALKFLFLPFAFPHGTGRLGNVAGHGHHERQGVLRGGDGVAPGGVHHHDAPFGGRRDVHVVQPGAGPTHHFQAGRGGNEIRGYLGGAPDDQGVGILDFGQQLLRFHAGLSHHVNIGMGLEDINPGLV